MRGKDLATNLEFHYGLLNWFIGNNINARPSTGFIVPYLTAVGQLKEAASQIDLSFAYGLLRSRHLEPIDDDRKSRFKTSSPYILMSLCHHGLLDFLDSKRTNRKLLLTKLSQIRVKTMLIK